MSLLIYSHFSGISSCHFLLGDTMGFWLPDYKTF